MQPTVTLGTAVDNTPELKYTTVGEGKQRLQDNGAAGSFFLTASEAGSSSSFAFDTSSISANTRPSLGGLGEGATAFLLKSQGKELKTGLPAFGAVIINGYTFLNGKYLLDILYNNYLISGGLKLGYTIYKLLDKRIIEL